MFNIPLSKNIFKISFFYCAFSSLTPLAGQQERHLACKKTEWWDAGMVMCLGQCHCHSLSLAPVNPDWFYLPGFTFLVLAHPRGL